MSLHVLDTDTVSLFQHGHAKVTAELQSHAPSEIAITVLTVEEQLSGWYKELRRAQAPQSLADVDSRMARTVQFFGRLNVLGFSVPAIHRYQGLLKLRLNVRKMDLRIAAVVLEIDATVVTSNVRDFSRVPGLKIEDWSK